jgi:hypothetical protein
MRTRTTTAGILAVLALTLTACDSGSDDKADTKPSTAPSELTPEQRASINAELGIPPEPKPAARAAYIADLDAISTDIVHGKPDKAIDRGRNQCSSIKQGKDRDELIESTNFRFSSPDHPKGHGTDIAAKILDVVHKRLCPDF